jgi:predicted ATP-grasp superfamily ATP-dependent carboligase
MNMFYTGLGIARSLGEQGIPVIGLTARRGNYGNYTRYATLRSCPDSRERPEALLAFLLELGAELSGRAVIFPTRDDDLMFLDRFRSALAPYFNVVMPESAALSACLNKWETYRSAQRAGVAAPRCWRIETVQDLQHAGQEVTYPCVLKPLSAHHWRKAGNWKIVGARKAIVAHSEEDLRREYALVARADTRAVVQEIVEGGDTHLLITACYLDRYSRCAGAFHTQKLVQIPEGFGTGCVVRSVDRSDLLEPTLRLLQSIGFSGIAEVEYKWDGAAGEYKLIEINPRPWDQHRLGKACGVDLIYIAYCDHAGLAMQPPAKLAPGHKWIAEDAFLAAALRMAWRRDPKLRSLLRQARGERIFAIWSAKDPLPMIAFLLRFLPELFGSRVAAAWSTFKRLLSGNTLPEEKGLVYESHSQKPKPLG